MGYADHIRQLLHHATHTSVAADWAVTAWLAAPHDYSAGQAAAGALGIAASAAHELRQAIRAAVAASVN